MQHFPIFLSLKDQHVIVSGGGEAALAKLRLLLKTPAQITVFSELPAGEIVTWAADERLTLNRRVLRAGDAANTALFYAADENTKLDATNAALAKADGALCNIVDNLSDSDFITPAIVDRNPVIVAIGTEGTAPVLARAIKSDLEERLPPALGTLARIGKAFRPMAQRLPVGRKRRAFWSDYYLVDGPRAFTSQGISGLTSNLENLLKRHMNCANNDGQVTFVGAGPGDAELLTLRARKVLENADVVIHDDGIPSETLELVRREARIVTTTDLAIGSIIALAVKHALSGQTVVRLVRGNANLTGALADESRALDSAGVDWDQIAGLPDPDKSASIHVLATHTIQEFQQRERG